MKTVPLNTEHLEKRLKPQLAYLQAHTKPPTASHHNEHIAQTKIFADSSISSDIDLVKVNIKFCNVSKGKKILLPPQYLSSKLLSANLLLQQKRACRRKQAAPGQKETR